ncbi:hypothetical protein [Paenibacillus alkalitolerans]|uniref:hypothetical protein n=1 Tax=Paenibacillus alkalitolerans TaxID=2799335 RepID=UPI0018F6591C|nr:hypothetical protein [Paenibacillus alkalitolerans]
MGNMMKLLGASICIILIVMIISGCGRGNMINGSIGKDDLENYVNKLHKLEDVFKGHRVKFQSSHSNEREGFLEIRRIGEHSKPLSDEEIASLKRSIYEAVGGVFPLNITVYTIEEQPGISGKITAIDKDGRFLVVSSDKFLDKEEKMPDAAWYAMSDDAEIEFEGKPVNAEDVKIGSSVKVWSEGRTIELDGEKHRLLPIAKVWLNGQASDASDIAVGDAVKIWFAGYEIGPEKMVTQVVIER